MLTRKRGNTYIMKTLKIFSRCKVIWKIETLAFKRLRQEKCCGFRDSLGYKMSSYLNNKTKIILKHK